MGHIPSAMFSSRGQSAWHRVGKIFPGKVTYSEALAASGCDAINASKVPLTLPWGDTCPNAHAIVDAKSGKVFSNRAVTDAYHVLQHREIFEAMRPAIEEHRLTPETGGVMFDGAFAWLACSFSDNEAALPGGDSVRAYAMLTNDHRGVASVMASISIIRPVCENTIEASHSAARKGGMLGSVAHTRGVRDGLKILADALGRGREVFRESVRVYRDLAKAPVKNMQAIATLAAATYGQPEIDAQAANVATPRMLDLVERFQGAAIGADMESAKGTLWGAYNAVTDRHRHHGGRDVAKRITSQTDAEQNARALLASIGIMRGDSRETVLETVNVSASR